MPTAVRFYGIRGVGATIERVSLTAGAVGVSLFTTAVIYVVMARYALRSTPAWAEELPRLLLVWVTFIGVAVSTIKRSHLKADILPLMVKNPAMRARIDVIAHTCTLAFLLFLGWAGWQISMKTWNSVTPALEISRAWMYIALPVNMLIACLVCFLPKSK